MLEKICKDCKNSFIISDDEERRFQELMEENPGFQMPVRCFPCRKKKRMQRDQERNEREGYGGTL